MTDHGGGMRKKWKTNMLCYVKTNTMHTFMTNIFYSSLRQRQKGHGRSWGKTSFRCGTWDAWKCQASRKAHTFFS